MGAAKPPEPCLVCSAPVWRRSPNGYAYCKPHYQEAEATAHQRAVFDDLLDWAPGLIDGSRLCERLDRTHGEVEPSDNTKFLAVAVAAVVNRWAAAFPPERLLEVEFALKVVQDEVRARWLAELGAGPDR